MRDYSEYIAEMRSEWIGRTVQYNGSRHTVIGVDYNGMLLIDLSARFTDTTAVDPISVQVVG